MEANHQGIETCQTDAIQRLRHLPNNQADPYYSIIIMLMMLILIFTIKNLNEYNRSTYQNEKRNIRAILKYICKIDEGRLWHTQDLPI